MASICLQSLPLQAVLGMYCHYILADYITLVAAPLGTGGSDMGSSGHGQPVHLLPGATAALKPGACALYGACSPAQVCRQASHMGLTNVQEVGGLGGLPSIWDFALMYRSKSKHGQSA